MKSAQIAAEESWNRFLKSSEQNFAMIAKTDNISSFVWGLVCHGYQNFNENVDELFCHNSVYVYWREKGRQIQILGSDGTLKLHRFIKRFGLFAPTAMIVYAAYNDFPLFFSAASVAWWAAQTPNAFPILKHSIIYTVEDGFTATALIAAAQFALKDSTSRALVGFVTGYSLYHLAMAQNRDAFPTQGPMGKSAQQSAQREDESDNLEPIPKSH